MRFTERYDDIFATTKDGRETHERGVRIKDKVGGFEKLANLEDIEEKLGIDLITLFKALQQDSIWVREHNTKEQEIVYERVRLNYLNHTLDFVEPRREIGKGRNLFDYGESWALTKEELL